MSFLTDIPWLAVVGAIFLVAGFVGCVVPVLPGPVLSYCGLLALVPTDRCPSVFILVAMGLLIAVVTVADYVVPALGARKFNCTRWGTFGCFVGTIVGLFFFPLGLLLGPFLGAIVGELIVGKSLGQALKGGWGAFLGFLAGIVLNILVCAAIAVAFVMAL